MIPSSMMLLLQALSALCISLFSAWLTVRLSQKRFRAERLWGRKVVAYERVIEAFHKSKKFSSEHMNAARSGGDVSEERDKELRLLAKEANEEIRKAADIGSFTISDEALNVLALYEKELDDVELYDWHTYLEHDFSITEKYMKKFIATAKKDLES